MEGHPEIGYLLFFEIELEWTLGRVQLTAVVFDCAVGGPVNRTAVDNFEKYAFTLTGFNPDFLMVVCDYFAVLSFKRLNHPNELK